jgi:hypothetical protein
LSLFKKIKDQFLLLREINERLKRLQQAVGRIEGRQLIAKDTSHFSSYEFQIYSQWGEDGIIQYILSRVNIEHSVFVEFGVENYMEANTRFLLVNDNWSGLVIDGDQDNINSIKQDSIYWKYNLKAECAFIDKDNINELIRSNGITGDIGILSVDIDGNDYWVWDAINVIKPRIVICEYNSLFGPEKSVTTPYAPRFIRTNAHYSNLYYGASISALTKLADIKGYALVGGNKAGNNIFFVRTDLMENLEEKSPSDVYIESQFRESRDENGNLTFLSMQERLELLKDMKIVNIEDGNEYYIKDVYEIR